METRGDIAAQPLNGGSPEIARDSDRDPTEVYRAGAYRLLAALLRAVPDRGLLEQLAGLAAVDGESDELARTLALLGQAAGNADVDALGEEFHALFIGLGRGELLPYGSWYLTGFLMEKPLGTLRDDLARLGYERNDGTREPEDHIAALCEVMSLLIGEGLDSTIGGGLGEPQAAFFQAHIDSWAERFFRDLSDAQGAVFYRFVGGFGLAFMAFERRYLSMDA